MISQITRRVEQGSDKQIGQRRYWQNFEYLYLFAFHIFETGPEVIDGRVVFSSIKFHAC